MSNRVQLVVTTVDDTRGAFASIKRNLGGLADAARSVNGVLASLCWRCRLPVVRQRPTGERIIHMLRWGLVPSWAKDETIATKLINARGETLADKPSFRSAYRKRRCEAQPLAAPCPDAVIAMHPVSRALGNVKNDEPGSIERVEAG